MCQRPFPSVLGGIPGLPKITPQCHSEPLRTGLRGGLPTQGQRVRFGACYGYGTAPLVPGPKIAVKLLSRTRFRSVGMSSVNSAIIPTTEPSRWRSARDSEGGQAGALPYSITSSARPSSVSGNVSPSAFAAFMLIASSTFVTCWTGRSAGLSPLIMRPV